MLSVFFLLIAGNGNLINKGVFMKDLFLSLLFVFSFSTVMAIEPDPEMDLQRRIALAEKAQKEAAYKDGLERSSLAGKVLHVTATNKHFYGVVQLLDGNLCSINHGVSSSAEFEVACYDKDGKVLLEEYIPYRQIQRISR